LELDFYPDFEAESICPLPFLLGWFLAGVFDLSLAGAFWFCFVGVFGCSFLAGVFGCSLAGAAGFVWSLTELALDLSATGDLEFV